MNAILNGYLEDWSSGVVDAQPDAWADYEAITVGVGSNNQESTQVKEGVYALRIDVAGLAAADYKGIEQPILARLIKGDSYILSGWVKNALITNGKVQFYVVGAVLGTAYALDSGVANADYTLCSIAFTVPLLETSLSVFCVVKPTAPACSGTAYFDNLIIEARVECNYCEPADIKAHMEVQWTSGGKVDVLLDDLIASASRLIDNELHWPDCHFAAGDLTDQTRYFDTQAGSEMWIPRCISITTFKIDTNGDGTYDQTWTQGTHFVVWPYDQTYFDKIIVKEGASRSFPTGQRRLEIVGKFGGYSVPPQKIKEACVITVARWLKRAQQMYQDTGAIVELGQLTYTKALDPDVQEILRVTARRIVIG